MPRASRPNIPCSLCKVEFIPNDDRWYRWQQGKPTYCSWECVKAKHAIEAHARNPDQPCTTCGKLFKLSESQRDKIKIRSSTGLYCSTECLYISRKTNPRKVVERKRGEKYFTARICGECNEEFVPSPKQRQWGAKHPEARSFCSTECDHQWRSVWMAENNAKIRRLIYVFGPSHPQWRHGLYSREMIEAQKLITSIKRFINEGAN